jgi:hypothetical protein
MLLIELRLRWPSYRIRSHDRGNYQQRESEDEGYGDF